jgi:hypothetical protein
MFNEFLIFVLVYHLVLFSDEYISTPAGLRGRDYSGYSMIFFTCLGLFVNLGALALSAAKDKIRAAR